MRAQASHSMSDNSQKLHPWGSLHYSKEPAGGSLHFPATVTADLTRSSFQSFLHLINAASFSLPSRGE